MRWHSCFARVCAFSDWAISAGVLLALGRCGAASTREWCAKTAVASAPPAVEWWVVLARLMRVGALIESANRYK